jgi:hypothetical protein
MTNVYQIDLLSAESLCSLGTIQKVVTVSHTICNSILQSIMALDISQFSPHKEILENQVHMLKWYMNTLKDIDARSANVPYMDITQVNVLRRIRVLIDEMPGIDHLRRRDELYSVVLINLMEGIFDSTLTCIRSKSETNLDAIFNECEDMFKLIIRKCRTMFPSLRSRNIPIFEKANMRVVLRDRRS